MDLATLIGLGIAGLGIVGGVFLDGGALGPIVRPAAALIVLGGTIGAVFVSYPLRTIFDAFHDIAQLFTYQPTPPEQTMEEILGYSRRARREGIMVLERHSKHASDPLLRQGLGLIADGHDASSVRSLLELKLSLLEDRLECGPRVLEAAGGYAPTVGILGAVLGLVQVLQSLGDITEVGAGIATAFVATLYGVGFANLWFLPLATKLRTRQQTELRRKEMILEGVVAIQDGVNPHLLEDRLRSFHEMTDATAA